MCGVNLKACGVIKICGHVGSGVAPLLVLCSVPLLPPVVRVRRLHFQRSTTGGQHGAEGQVGFQLVEVKGAI